MQEQEVRSKFVGETQPISRKEATLRKQAIEKDYTIPYHPSVGQLHNNLHKCRRISQKTSFGP
jgi:hypothetical protein